MPLYLLWVSTRKNSIGPVPTEDDVGHRKCVAILEDDRNSEKLVYYDGDVMVSKREQLIKCNGCTYKHFVGHSMGLVLMRNADGTETDTQQLLKDAVHFPSDYWKQENHKGWFEEAVKKNQDRYKDSTL
jgi:hypothetical protein